MTDRDAALAAWWSGALGRALVAAESELLGEALEDVFGWELLQIGVWGGARELLAGSRTRRQTIVAAPGFPSGADIIGRPSQLPVSSDSVDAVLLPHTLEFASDPYAIVREVDRVLVGEGQLLVLGFRPWTLWGIRARASRSGFPPGLRRVLAGTARARLVGIARLRGRRVQAIFVLQPVEPGPAPGAGTGRILNRGITHPLPGSAYLLKARKRVYTLTPVRPRFREKPAVLGGLVKPTTRSQS